MNATMNTTFGSRSILLALGLGFSLATACFDEEVLENEDCSSNSDCWKTQECVQTAYQAEASNINSFGWCRPEGEGCAVGEQPGCECLLEGGVRSCTSPDYTVALCPSADDDSCTCVYPSTIDPTLTDNTVCPG
jgi:hypothetical protein